MKTCPQCDTGYPDSHTTCPTHGLLLNEIRDLKPGMVIHQSYRIIRKLGQGGMGAVYLAQHTLMNEPQALKFLSSELSHDEAFTARFLREVRTLRQVRHKNVVYAGNLEPAEDGTLFFSMEFVDGPDLRAFLRDPQSHSAEDHAALKGHDFSRAANDPKEAPALAAEGSFSSISPISPNFSASSAGALPVPLALSIARQIAEGLGAAHAKGMVHRDIKPENILLKRDAAAWLPKIADFGIVATKESSTAYTRTGGTLLTMAYAAPEQWHGTPAAELDGRTDLYALGGLLYEMLTGQTPFHAENYEGWARQHQTTPPQPPSILRPALAAWQGLDALVLRLLAKDREDRPKDVIELVGLIDAVRYKVPSPHPATIVESLPKPVTTPSRSGILKWAIAAVIVLGMGIWLATRFFHSTADISTEGTQTPAHAPGGGLNPAVQQFKEGRSLYYQKRYEDARPLFQKACDGGEMMGCTGLGSLYAHGQGVKQSNTEARALYQRACDGGEMLGCANLGSLYESGHGMKQDYVQERVLFQKACDGGEMMGCTGIGFLYEKGQGVKQDFAQARALYQRACDGGEMMGCTDLGSLYAHGQGVKRGNTQARALYQKACDGGEMLGCQNLGFLYGSGQGVKQDYAQACVLFQKACDGGNAIGCSSLGDCYWRGLGVEKDMEKAKQLYSKGCSEGFQWGCDRLKETQ